MPDDTPLRLRFGPFELDEQQATLARDGKPLTLPPKAFALLCHLARQPGRLVTKEALLDAVWGHRYVSDSVLKTTMSELRTAIGDSAKQPSVIETAARRGYRFIAAPVAVTPAAQAGPMPVSAVATQPFDAVPMVGREAELARLNAAWSEAQRGRRRMVWISGEAGVGKSTLIERFLADARPGISARGQCVEQHGVGEPYLPVLEALSALCRIDPTLPALLRSVAPAWLLQLPWLASDVERDTLRRELAGASPERMLRELGELLDRYTSEQPLLLVIEDLHWSDVGTLRLLDHVARRRSPARLMWLASFRLAEVIAEDHPLKALRHELKLHRLADEIVLDAFSEHELARYIDLRTGAGEEASEAFVRALHARTDGLPLFVANVIDELVSQGSLTPAMRDDVPLREWHLPESLAGVIAKHMARLPPEAQALLNAASVCGVEFRVATVAAVLERPVTEASECCDLLARQGQWLKATSVARLPDGSLDELFAFRHALYRHAVYEAIGAATRARWHQRAALQLEKARHAGSEISAVELASHYELSHDLVPALRHYGEAAHHALRRFAPRLALDLAERALALLPACPDPSARVALEMPLVAARGAASAQALGISAPATKQAFKRARDLLETLGSHPMQTLVLHGLGLVLFTRGEYAETRAVGEHIDALARAEGDPILAVCACNLLGQVNLVQGRQREARRLLERGLAVCDELGDARLFDAFVVDANVQLRCVLALALLHAGLVERAQACLDEARQRALRLGQPVAQMAATWYGALMAIRLGDARLVRACGEEMAGVIEAAALPQGVGPSRWYQGWALAHMGEPRQALPLIREALDHNLRLGMFAGASEVLAYVAEALALCGDWPAAKAQLDEAFELARKLDERVYLTQMSLLRSRIASAEGDDRGAREAIGAAFSEAREQDAPWLELTALVAHMEQGEASKNDFDALRAVRSRIVGGADVALVKRADELLATKA